MRCWRRRGGDHLVSASPQFQRLLSDARQRWQLGELGIRHRRRGKELDDLPCTIWGAKLLRRDARENKDTFPLRWNLLDIYST